MAAPPGRAGGHCLALYRGATAAQEAFRNYLLDLPGGQAAQLPLLSVYGGKITTYRRLADSAMARLAQFFPGMGGAWTASAPLPGGDFPWDGLDSIQAALCRRFPFLLAATAARLVRAYGTLAAEVLGDARSPADLGRAFGAGLTEREVDWLTRNEWARTADDVLWRRSKLGLRVGPDAAAALERYLAG